MKNKITLQQKVSLEDIKVTNKRFVGMLLVHDVQGSQGNTYQVYDGKCSCPAYGRCKHIVCVEMYEATARERAKKSRQMLIEAFDWETVFG